MGKINLGRVILGGIAAGIVGDILMIGNSNAVGPFSPFRVTYGLLM